MIGYSYQLDMTLRQLEIFMAIVNTGRFTTAAQKLFVAQPSVSGQIHALEQELGEELFVRLRNRKIHLTESGLILKDHAVHILHQVEMARMDIASFSHEPSGRIRLGFAGHQLTSMIPPAISAFHNRYPRICVDIVNGTTPQLVEALRTNRLDIAVLNLSSGARELDISVLLTESLVVVARKSDPLARRRTVEAKTLKDTPLVLYDQTTSMRQLIDAFFRRSGINPNIILELSSVEAMKRMVQAGLGVSIIPESALLGVADSDGLQALRIRGNPLTRQLGLAKPNTARMPAAVNEMISLITNRFVEIRAMLDHSSPSARAVS